MQTVVRVVSVSVISYKLMKAIETYRTELCNCKYYVVYTYCVDKLVDDILCVKFILFSSITYVHIIIIMLVVLCTYICVSKNKMFTGQKLKKKIQHRELVRRKRKRR